ncbi:hypothetical protein CFter6_0152 [Collimonas fungivorans]|uniref:Uncharacterized protein n=1 Tax=Collimonas fungivorans TaxID=158899 RepID=A0A127P579_9BURK|nr:hypothetical protein CFter6_0152 [Collimonas fungivorans]
MLGEKNLCVADHIASDGMVSMKFLLREAANMIDEGDEATAALWRASGSL